MEGRVRLPRYKPLTKDIEVIDADVIIAHAAYMLDLAGKVVLSGGDAKNILDIVDYWYAMAKILMSPMTEDIQHNKEQYGFTGDKEHLEISDEQPSDHDNRRYGLHG